MGEARDGLSAASVAAVSGLFLQTISFARQSLFGSFYPCIKSSAPVGVSVRTGAHAPHE